MKFGKIQPLRGVTDGIFLTKELHFSPLKMPNSNNSSLLLRGQ